MLRHLMETITVRERLWKETINVSRFTLDFTLTFECPHFLRLPSHQWDSHQVRKCLGKGMRIVLCNDVLRGHSLSITIHIHSLDISPALSLFYYHAIRFHTGLTLIHIYIFIYTTYTYTSSVCVGFYRFKDTFTPNHHHHLSFFHPTVDVNHVAVVVFIGLVHTANIGTRGARNVLFYVDF